MAEWKFKTILIVILSIHYSTNASVKELLSSQPNIEINEENSSLSELMQIQANTIKKILSDTQKEHEQNTTTKCNNTSIIPKRSDVNENAEKNQIPTTRTLFSFYSNSEINKTITEKPTKTTDNYVLVPCWKKVAVNETRRRLDYGEKDEEKPTSESLTKNINQSLVLDKIYAPNGYFLYYPYRTRNQGSESSTQLTPSLVISTTTTTTTPITTTSTTTSTTSTTTSTTTTTPAPEPVYKEQLKFVLPMPHAEPESLSTYPWYFDRYAYYPKFMQPAYVNAPARYKPVYHMIRTLTIPSRYLHANSENIKNRH